MTTPIMNMMMEVSIRPLAASQSRAEMSFGSTLCGARNEATIGITTVDVAIAV